MPPPNVPLVDFRVLALGLLFSFPAAGDSKEIQDLLVRIRGGDGESVAKDLEGSPMREALRADPGSLAEVCRAADLASKCLAGKAPAAAPRVGEALLELAPGDPMAGSVPERRARLHALLADARIRRELSKPVDTVPFLRAGAALEMLAGEFPTEPAYLVDAARAFGDAAWAAGEKGQALWDRAEQHLSTLRFKHARALDAYADGVSVLLDRVRWGAARKEKGLEARIDLVLSLVAEARKEDPRHAGLATVRNDAVTSARVLGIRRSGLEYESDRICACFGLLVEVPTGLRWRSSEQVPQAIQVDPVFGGARTMEFTAYGFETPYTLADGSQVRGDGMKDMAGRNLDIAVAALKKVGTRHPVAAGRLRQCPQGWMFEVSGTDAKGAFRRRREWYFKSATDRRQTYRVVVLETEPGLADDPAFQSVLDSVKEAPK